MSFSHFYTIRSNQFTHPVLLWSIFSSQSRVCTSPRVSRPSKLSSLLYHVLAVSHIENLIFSFADRNNRARAIRKAAPAFLLQPRRGFSHTPALTFHILQGPHAQQIPRPFPLAPHVSPHNPTFFYCFLFVFSAHTLTSQANCFILKEVQIHPILVCFFRTRNRPKPAQIKKKARHCLWHIIIIQIIQVRSAIQQMLKFLPNDMNWIFIPIRSPADTVPAPRSPTWQRQPLPAI